MPQKLLSVEIPKKSKERGTVRCSKNCSPTTILELEAGKIRRESGYWDAATFRKQVGPLPSQQRRQT
jgi:hypothetical protein